MSLLRLCTRLTKLEARRPPVAEMADPPQEFSDDFVADVYRLLWAHGQFSSVVVMLEQCAGLTDDASIAAVSQMLETGDTL